MGKAGNAVNKVLSDSANSMKRIATGRTFDEFGYMVEDLATGGQRNIVGGLVSGETQKNEVDKIISETESIDKKAEEALTSNEEKSQKTASNMKERARQRKIAASKSGRKGTILTSQIGSTQSEETPVKTLLGM